MNKILIISPHFPPSNLAAVHRSRLFALHLPSFNWLPIILSVKENFYEEALDWNLVKLLPSTLRIEKVSAFPVSSPRLIGDIGLRAFLQLHRKALNLIKNEHIDFIYIPIPSFYCALLGRLIHDQTGIPYGIDYIDPWVHIFPGSERLFSRHWWSSQLSKWLEPIAIKKASLITGVAEGYYQGVLDRNPHLRKRVVSGAMPYGGEESDHAKVKEFKLKPYLFKNNPDKYQLVYAGAMLPKAYAPLEAIFKAIQSQPNLFESLEIHFIGTGKSTNDPAGFNVKPLAEAYGLWLQKVFEYPQRIPYLDVLTHLESAKGVFILGSTEPHYTPSKVYQGVLSNKPILAVLHSASSAVAVVKSSRVGLALDFNGLEDIDKITNQFSTIWQQWKTFSNEFSPDLVDIQAFAPYSAKETTHQLAILLEDTISRHKI